MHGSHRRAAGERAGIELARENVGRTFLRVSSDIVADRMIYSCGCGLCCLCVCVCECKTLETERDS